MGSLFLKVEFQQAHVAKWHSTIPDEERAGLEENVCFFKDVKEKF
jgi:hypothetical protein